MENSLLVTGVVGLFIFAAVMGTITMTGHVIEPSNGQEGIQDTICIENWECSGWSDCIDGQQTRKCHDVNECGTAISKPPIAQDCESQTEWHSIEGIENFADNEDEITKPFNVPYDTWRVVWSCSDMEGDDNEGLGHALVSIYREGQNSFVAYDYCKCEDFIDREEPREIIMEESGSFYLKVQAKNLERWSVYIEAKY